MFTFINTPVSTSSFLGTTRVSSAHGSCSLTTLQARKTNRTSTSTIREHTSMVIASSKKKPTTKPASPCFSSGPCKKRPGYKIEEVMKEAPLGRSHRSKIGKQKISESIELTKQVLQIPEDYKVAIVPGSDTGAFEMIMWSVLGAKPIDVCYWESFGKGWYTDIMKHLKLDNVNQYTVDEYGQLPNLSQCNADHDIIFTFNGTTSGVRVPFDLDFISNDRTGLTMCDATSAVFAMPIQWDKIDCLTYSWQKVLGGEAAHGMLILSPRAVERLESFVPENRPLPKIFRMTDKNGKLNEGLFKGNVINTVSMLCVEDYLDALKWCESIGGLDSLVQRSMDNLKVIEDFVERNEWADFLASDANIRSNTSVCLTLQLEKDKVKQMEKLLEEENVAYDINSYRDAPPGLRIWCGATVETSDVVSLTSWIEWAYSVLTEN